MNEGGVEQHFSTPQIVDNIGNDNDNIDDNDHEAKTSNLVKIKNKTRIGIL
jgi:hypothetical protein